MRIYLSIKVFEVNVNKFIFNSLLLFVEIKIGLGINLASRIFSGALGAAKGSDVHSQSWCWLGFQGHQRPPHPLQAVTTHRLGSRGCRGSCWGPTSSGPALRQNHAGSEDLGVEPWSLPIPPPPPSVCLPWHLCLTSTGLLQLAVLRGLSFSICKMGGLAQPRYRRPC